MRIALGIEYDGSHYHGWQAQTGYPTIQQVIESAISQIADTDIHVAAAGRTDAGVHATNQVIHFDYRGVRRIQSWQQGVNTLLPKDICVKWVCEVPDEFHARYSAVARRYRYIIYNSTIRSALLRNHVTWCYRPLAHLMMNEASHDLIGEHDFTSFRSSECQSRSPIRRIIDLQVYRLVDFVIIDITANAFLHHMVRNIAGVLIAVGSGKKTIQWVQDTLKAKDRCHAAETAKPSGLYLVNVLYGNHFNLPKQPLGPLFIRHY